MLFLAVTPLGCSYGSIIAIICLSGFFSGFAYAGVRLPNIIDLSPKHAGKFWGFGNTISNFSGFVAPQGFELFYSTFIFSVMGALIADQEYSIEGWKYVWITCCIVSLVGKLHIIRVFSRFKGVSVGFEKTQ